MRSSRWPLLLTTGAVLVFVVVAARGVSPISVNPPGIHVERGAPLLPLTASEPQRQRDETLGDILTVLGIGGLIYLSIAALLLLVALLMVLSNLRLSALRKPRRPDPTEPVGAEAEGLELIYPVALADAVRSARGELARRADGELADAVVAAWLRLEEAAAAHGAQRQPHQTSTEFTANLLARYTTNVPALDQLRALYQRARFGPAVEIGRTDAAAAAAALDRILEALTTRPERVAR